MPRKPRTFEIGEIYHIVNRGVEKRMIFLKNQDYNRFILGLEFFNTQGFGLLWNLVAKAGKAGSDPANHAKIIKNRLEHAREKKQKPIIELLAFTLMPNHYHLILREIIDGGISLFMHKMGGYSSYFNKQYDRVGSLFQSRYKAVHIQDDEQLGVAFAYVHTNPIEITEPDWKNGTVKNVKQSLEWLTNYPWSSYRDYIGIPTFPKVTQRSFFLDFYGDNTGCKRSVEDWVHYKARDYITGTHNNHSGV